MSNKRMTLAEIIWLIKRAKGREQIPESIYRHINEDMKKMYEVNYQFWADNVIKKSEELNNNENIAPNPPEYVTNYSIDPSENLFLNKLCHKLGNRVICNEGGPDKISVLSKNYQRCAKIRVEHTYVIEIGAEKKIFKREKVAREYLEENGFSFDSGD